MEIQIDWRQLAEVKAALVGIEKGWERATSRALNKTLASLRTEAAREIKKDINLTHSRILKTFSIKRATAGYLTARLDSRGRPVGLASYIGTRQVQKGVSVKVLTGGKRSILKHAFLATTRHAKKTGETTEVTNVFWRKYEGPRVYRPTWRNVDYPSMPHKFRFPLARLAGPRIQDIYAKPTVSERVMAKADALVSKHLEHETQYLLQSLAGVPF